MENQQQKQAPPAARETTTPSHEATPILDELIGKASEVHDGLLVTWDKTAAHSRTSIAKDRPDRRPLITAALEKADSTFQEFKGEFLDVVDYFAHITDRPADENGEITPAWRIVFFLADGTTVSTWSWPTVKTWAYIAEDAGPGPYDPPIRIRPRLNGVPGRKYYTIREIYVGDKTAPKQEASKEAKSKGV